MCVRERERREAACHSLFCYKAFLCGRSRLPVCINEREHGVCPASSSCVSPFPSFGAARPPLTFPYHHLHHTTPTTATNPEPTDSTCIALARQVWTWLAEVTEEEEEDRGQKVEERAGSAQRSHAHNVLRDVFPEHVAKVRLAVCSATLRSEFEF